MREIILSITIMLMLVAIGIKLDEIEKKIENIPVYCVFNDGGDIEFNISNATGSPAVNIDFNKCRKFIWDNERAQNILTGEEEKGKRND